jgi:L-lactate permease
VKFTELANAAKLVAKEIGAFLQDSLKQYAESDRIQKQLARSAGEYTEMIDAQSIVVSATATGVHNQEGAILRRVFPHSLALAALMGLLVWLQSGPLAWMVPG